MTTELEDDCVLPLPPVEEWINTEISRWVTKASGRYRPPTKEDGGPDGLVIVSQGRTGLRMMPWEVAAKDTCDWLPWDAVEKHPWSGRRKPQPGDFYEHQTLRRIGHRMFVGVDPDSHNGNVIGIMTNRLGRRDCMQMGELLTQWRYLPDCKDWGPEDDWPDVDGRPQPTTEKHKQTVGEPYTVMQDGKPVTVRSISPPPAIQKAMAERRRCLKRREGVLGVRPDGDGPDVYHTSVFLRQNETIKIREVKYGDPTPETVARVLEKMDAAIPCWYGLISMERVKEWASQLRGKE